MKNKIKHGFSMIELIIVIAVLGVLTAVVLNQAQGMRESSRLNTESTNLAMLTTTVQSMFNKQLNYNGLTNEIILRSPNFPDAMRSPVVNAIRTSWDDDAVNVQSLTGADAYKGQDHSSFSITYDFIPHTVCVDFAAANFNGFYRMDINGTIIHNTEPDTPAVQYNVATVLASCTDPGDSTFTFYSR